MQIRLSTITRTSKQFSKVRVRMSRKKVLFISGSLGLGHVGRDIEIAKALRKKEPDFDIWWLAEDPASMVLEQAGEKLIPEAKLVASSNAKLEDSVQGFNANLIKATMNSRKDWSDKAKLVSKVVEKEGFDLVVGDETYEIVIEAVNNPDFKKFPLVMIYDFIGVDSVTRNPVDAIATYLVNRIWAKGMQAGTSIADKSLFIGEVEDIPDRKFGFMLPNRRELAIKSLDFVGYILTFDPTEYKDKDKVRRLLGYNEDPLIICSIGGTSAGKNLLDLCVKAYPLMKNELPDLRMILVCGPHLSPDSIQTVEGIEAKGYVPEMFKHLAAADLGIVVGGGTITLELTALQKPFLYFPLKQHFEQEMAVTPRCERHRAGVKMDFEKTTPQSLAKEALLNISRKVNYPSIPINGAENAAHLISQTLRD
jgi:predicted glycosyltransferase